MAGSMDDRDQSGSDPNANFPPAGVSQFAQPYSFPIDSELTMTAGYNVSPYARQLEDAATSSVDGSSNRPMDMMSMGPNGTAPAANVDPSMAPPQTANQPNFTPTAQRSSVGASPDPTQTPQTGDKRKRSKTSRACDECRRKKVRLNIQNS